MNLLPKRNLWVMKSVQVVRMFSATGPNWSTGSDGVTSSNRPPVDSGKKKGSKENVIEAMGYVTPHGLACDAQAQAPLPASEGNPGMPITGKPLSKAEESEKKADAFLTRYYGDQVKYFKQIAKVNKDAMKRIKKLRKDWLKFVENHF